MFSIDKQLISFIISLYLLDIDWQWISVISIERPSRYKYIIHQRGTRPIQCCTVQWSGDTLLLVSIYYYIVVVVVVCTTDRLTTVLYSGIQLPSTRSPNTTQKVISIKSLNESTKRLYFTKWNLIIVSYSIYRVTTENIFFLVQYIWYMTYMMIPDIHTCRVSTPHTRVK